MPLARPVLVAPSGVRLAEPGELTLITSPLASNAKLCGALILEGSVSVAGTIDQSFVSSSAMNPSLNSAPGSSSVRKRKLSSAQLADLRDGQVHMQGLQVVDAGPRPRWARCCRSPRHPRSRPGRRGPRRPTTGSRSSCRPAGSPRTGCRPRAAGLPAGGIAVNVGAGDAGRARHRRGQIAGGAVRASRPRSRRRAGRARASAADEEGDPTHPAKLAGRGPERYLLAAGVARHGPRTNIRVRLTAGTAAPRARGGGPRRRA